MGSMMSTNPHTEPRCATCEEWIGNGNLKRGGNRPGEIAYEYGVQGKCKIHKIEQNSEGNCRMYRISPKARDLV